MQRARLTTAALLLGSFLAGSAVAQDAGAPAPQPSTETAPEVAPAPEAAQAAPEVAPAAPESNLSVTAFQDWELRCETSSDNCFIYQLARDQNQNPVSEVSIVALPEGGEAVAGITIITPLGTLLTAGVVVQVDEGEARQYPFNWCTRSGCFARFGMTSAEVDALRRGAKARMRLVSVSAPDQPVLLDISLSGFTAAFRALTEG